MLRFVGPVAGVALLAGAVASCLEPTEIVLQLSTNATCASVSTDGVIIRVGTPGTVDTDGAQRIDTSRCTDPKALGSLVLLPTSGADEDIAITVTLGINQSTSNCLPTTSQPTPDMTNCIVAKRQLRFVPHHKLLLPIQLDTACAGVACDEGFTCIAGKCQGEGVECDGGTCNGGVVPDAGADATTDALPILDTGIDIGPVADACTLCPDTGTSCVNLATDKLNCGQCGIDCSGGTCQNGSCTLSTSLLGSTCLAVFGGDVYVTGPLFVSKVPTNGATLPTTLETLHDGRGIASNAATVVWGETLLGAWWIATPNKTSSISAGADQIAINNGEGALYDFTKGQVHYITLATSTALTLNTTVSQSAQGGVAISAKRIYVTNAVASVVCTTPTPTGNTTCLTQGTTPTLASPRGIVVEDPNANTPNVWFTNAGTDVWRTDSALGSPVVVATGGTGLTGVAWDSAQSTVYVMAKTAIEKVVGSSLVPVASVGTNASPCIAVDATSVYWADGAGIHKHFK